jgi:hypothetical protein
MDDAVCVRTDVMSRAVGRLTKLLITTFQEVNDPIGLKLCCNDESARVVEKSTARQSNIFNLKK